MGREDGRLPSHIHTRITVLPQHRLLKIRVEGLSVETDPDRTTSREVMNTLFELASDHNIITLDAVSPPLFTQRIVLVAPYGQPFAAKVGVGIRRNIDALAPSPCPAAGRVELSKSSWRFDQQLHRPC